MSFAELVLAITIGFDVEFKEQAFSSIFALETLDATFRDADGNVFLAVFAGDFFGSLNFEDVKADVDVVIRHVFGW